MDRGFWDNFNKPIIGLSPMDGVTDAAFRYMNAKYGKPSIQFTEFTSVEGLSAGAVKLLDDFIFDDTERPIAAQIFGSTPECFYRAAFIVSELGFDGIDINMGCPAKNVAHHGGGAALILQPDLAKEIIRRTKQGTEDWANGRNIDDIGLPEDLVRAVKKLSKQKEGERTALPVSVKTRIGHSSIVVEDWTKHLLEAEPVNISIHGRTLKQMYTGRSDWEAIGRAAEIIHKTSTTALGNGDIESLTDAKSKIKQFGVDGVLIGRAAMGNPWVFQDRSVSLQEKLLVALEHARYFEFIFPQRPFLNMRKHLSWYVKGFDGAKDLRMKLMTTQNAEDCRQLVARVAS